MYEREKSLYYGNSYTYSESGRGYGFQYDDDLPVKRGTRQFSFTGKGLALLLACCIVVSAMFGTAGAVLHNHLTGATIHHSFGSPPIRLAPMNIDLATATGSALSIQEIIDIAGDAVVEIDTQRTTATGFTGQRIVQQGAGSGVIISTDGFIMTNNHVIANSNRVDVTLRNGDTFEARLIGYDRLTDIAVLKINTTGLTPVIFGDSNNVAMGDLAVAIGNPLGQLGGTATVGIISALDRQLTIDNLTMTLLQTDASINQGNSGGGIFNQYGEIIGLVVAKSHGLGIEGLGFAIPINTAYQVSMNLIEHGFVTGRPQIGIMMADWTTAERVLANDVRFPGIYIVAVNAPNARAAGLMERDMLHYIEDVRIQSMSDVTDILQRHNVGDVIRIVVFRDNEVMEFMVELSEQGTF